MVFQGDLYDPAQEEEFIYIKDQKKDDDDEMQMLTPIMLESMFDLKSPPDLFRIVKGDKADDDTEVTTESFSDILLPTLNTPPRIMNLGADVDDDDASEISFDSYYHGEVPSPRNVISTGHATSYPLQIPADIRYEGEVSFSTAPISRTIHLQPRQSANAQSIFVPKAFPEEYPVYNDYALADSVSTYGGDYGGGAEECKDEDDCASSADEGFAYVHAGGDRCKEEDYWGIYVGHYGSRDFSNEHDYADDHASVQSIPEPVYAPSPHYQTFERQASPTTFLEELQDVFASCFSCGGPSQWSAPDVKSAFSNQFVSARHGSQSFGPADYGVSQSSAPRTPLR